MAVVGVEEDSGAEVGTVVIGGQTDVVEVVVGVVGPVSGCWVKSMSKLPDAIVVSSAARTRCRAPAEFF
jgi:hypothetical protein